MFSSSIYVQKNLGLTSSLQLYICTSRGKIRDLGPRGHQFQWIHLCRVRSKSQILSFGLQNLYTALKNRGLGAYSIDICSFSLPFFILIFKMMYYVCCRQVGFMRRLCPLRPSPFTNSWDTTPRSRMARVISMLLLLYVSQIWHHFSFQALPVYIRLCQIFTLYIWV